MTVEQRLIDSALRAWRANADRITRVFVGMSDEQLAQEVAPGRNRLRYLWGHVAAVNDALLPLLGIGPRLHPELDAMFLENPDRHVAVSLAGAELERVWLEIDGALWRAFTQWSAADWLAKHTAVSDEAFQREPHRNRFTVVLDRTAHMASHYGQALLTKRP